MRYALLIDISRLKECEGVDPLSLKKLMKKMIEDGFRAHNSKQVEKLLHTLKEIEIDFEERNKVLIKQIF